LHIFLASVWISTDIGLLILEVVKCTAHEAIRASDPVLGN